MFNMWILAKYAVILQAVGMNCTRDGALLERVKNHDAPTFKISAPPSIQNYTAPLPLRSHTLMGSIVFFRIAPLASGVDMVWVF